MQNLLLSFKNLVSSTFSYFLVKKNISFTINVVSRGRDPNAVAVLLEDSAALAGILIAAASLGLTEYTGNLIFDAIGSITIGGKKLVWLICVLQILDDPWCV